MAPADRMIWSGEHGAWWGPDESGYVTEARAAGRYTLKEADEIAAGCGPDKMLRIELAPEFRPDWPPAARDLSHIFHASGSNLEDLYRALRLTKRDMIDAAKRLQEGK